jgi:hypothetical protein
MQSKKAINLKQLLLFMQSANEIQRKLIKFDIDLIE